MICAMSSAALHAGRTRRARGVPSAEIRGLVRADLKAHVEEQAKKRGVSVSLYLEELLAADADAKREASDAA